MKNDQIGMTIYFASSVIHISNLLPKVWSTSRILYIETEIKEKVKNK